jgi:ABC-type polysaccharide/polyol phosphate export permease
MQKPRLPKLIRLCSYLIKAFCATFALILLLFILLGVFGSLDSALFLLTSSIPWLLRCLICIGCTIAVTSMSESL